MMTSSSLDQPGCLLVIMRFEWSVLGHPEVGGLFRGELSEVGIK